MNVSYCAPAYIDDLLPDFLARNADGRRDPRYWALHVHSSHVGADGITVSFVSRKNVLAVAPSGQIRKQVEARFDSLGSDYWVVLVKGSAGTVMIDLELRARPAPTAPAHPASPPRVPKKTGQGKTKGMQRSAQECNQSSPVSASQDA